MLTGDNQGTAERIAKSLGIEKVFADVLPGDKASKHGGSSAIPPSASLYSERKTIAT
jgi:magnesium-transporting ATPase (P-type)